jgi:hypothetical protein
VLLNVVSGTTTGQKFQFTATGTTTHLYINRTSAATATIANVSVQSAGALPTNWLNPSGTLINGGATYNVVGVGTTNGANTIDIRIVGTPTGSQFANLFTDSNTNTACVYGQTWTGSALMAIVGGSTTNLTQLNQLISGRVAGGGAGTLSLSTSVLSLGSTLTRVSTSATVTASTDVFLNMTAFSINVSAAPIDITVRVGWPQLENNSLINSTVASAVKAADGTGGVNGSAVYSVGGGSGSTTATLNVTWTAGVMAVNSVANAGSYTTFPPSPSTLTYVSGTATGWTGATVTLTPTNLAANAAASNPILTTSAAVTRNTEINTLVLTGLPAFGSAWTLWARATPQITGANEYLFAAVSGTNRTSVLRGTTGLPLIVDIDPTGGTFWSAAISGAPTWTIGSSAKIAQAVQTGDQAACFNGGSVDTKAGTMTLAPNAVNIGVMNNQNIWNGNIEELAIWFTQRVPNATLQSITT